MWSNTQTHFQQYIQVLPMLTFNRGKIEALKSLCNA